MASPDKIIAKGTDIYRFLPQRPPMVMIDTFISCHEKTNITSFDILPENIFIKDGFFTEPGIIENIAQTAAAGLGYAIVNGANRDDVPIGVIGAIKDLKIYFLPKAGVTIKTEVNVVYELMNASVIHGKITLENRTVAHCEMKIFLVNGQVKQ
jgi:3-hydroxymyristoyl/3-hydroxydecanoyl-(acyl carrier protein) dehydratase